MRSLEHFLIYALGPTAAILVFEHLVLRYVYGKTSALDRLTHGLSSTSITDLAHLAFLWSPLPVLLTVFRALTIPGAFLAFIMWAKGDLDFGGVLNIDPDANYLVLLLMWYLAFDFGAYISHLLMHRVPFLWRFHKLHHASTEMTIINGTRTAFAERAFADLFMIGIPFLMFGFPRPEIVLSLVLTRQVIELLQHSDLPWDYGLLGHIIAGPRFHRMHHSNAREDYDTNYGNLFTFWDRIFGTASTRYTQTGGAAADKVQLGLSADENRHYNRWWYALINETFIEYAWNAMRRRR